jgi:hypothetical protein
MAGRDCVSLSGDGGGGEMNIFYVVWMCPIRGQRREYLLPCLSFDRREKKKGGGWACACFWLLLLPSLGFVIVLVVGVFVVCVFDRSMRVPFSFIRDDHHSIHPWLLLPPLTREQQWLESCTEEMQKAPLEEGAIQT